MGPHHRQIMREKKNSMDVVEKKTLLNPDKLSELDQNQQYGKEHKIIN